MPRTSNAQQDLRYQKLVRLTCDMLDGIYLLKGSNGTFCPKGTIVKSQALNEAGYSPRYKDGYKIFDKPGFKHDVDVEMQRRREIDMDFPIDKPLPGETQNDTLLRLVDHELLYRLKYEPKAIPLAELVKVKAVSAKVKADGVKGAKGKDEDDPKQLPEFQNLIIMLNGKIPADSAKQIEDATGITIDGEAVEETT